MSNATVTTISSEFQPRLPLYFLRNQVEDFATYFTPGIFKHIRGRDIGSVVDGPRLHCVHFQVCHFWKSSLFDSGPSHDDVGCGFFGSETQMMLQPMVTSTVSYFKDTCEGIKPVRKSSIFPLETHIRRESPVLGSHVG
jgi:hypothetical protein